MICTYCQSPNSESNHRCHRCGRRLSGSAVSAPPEYQSQGYQSQSVGATALAVENTAVKAARANSPEPATRPSQPSLFADESAPRVIPFDARQRESLLKTSRSKRPVDANLAETAYAAAGSLPPRRAAKAARQGGGDPRGEQSTLDFLQSVPQSARTLRTTVEAVIFCDSPVASPTHRATAALLDASMVFLGLGVFFTIFVVFGGPFPWTKQNVSICAAAVALVFMLYGFVWSLCGRETAGMRWTGLRVINFNGFPPDGKSRALRLIGCWLSYCSGLIGILWALVDEESLTWHDHMSKTFPTFVETSATLSRSSR